MERHVGDQPSTTSSSSAARERGDGRGAVGAPDDELAQQRIVVRRHLVAAVQVAVHAHARAAWRQVVLDHARLRPEVVLRVLGVDAELDGVAAQLMSACE